MAKQKSSPCLTFFNRLEHFNADLELVDVIDRNIRNRKLTTIGSDKLFDELRPILHKTLSSRRNCDQNRKIAIRHLKSTLYTSYLKELFEEVITYIKEIMKIAAVSGLKAEQLVGESTKVQFTVNELLNTKNHAEVIDIVISKIFQDIEAEKDSKKLLTKINNRLGLGIEEIIIEEVLPYFEIRHLLVHADGKASESFKTKYTDFEIDEKGYIVINYQLIRNARDNMYKIVNALEEKAVEKGYI